MPEITFIYLTDFSLSTKLRRAQLYIPPQQNGATDHSTEAARSLFHAPYDAIVIANV